MYYVCSDILFPFYVQFFISQMNPLHKVKTVLLLLQMYLHSLHVSQPDHAVLYIWLHWPYIYYNSWYTSIFVFVLIVDFYSVQVASALMIFVLFWRQHSKPESSGTTSESALASHLTL